MNIMTMKTKTFPLVLCAIAILLVAGGVYRGEKMFMLVTQQGESDVNNKSKDYLRCEGHGRAFVESSMALFRKDRERLGPEYQLPPQLLIEAEACAAAFYALSQEKTQHEQQQNGIFGINSTLREDIANIFTTLGIAERRKNNPDAQLYFLKAVRISTNSREAKWHLSQLPEEPTLLPEEVSRQSRQSVLCCAAKDEEAYIDE